MRDFGVRVSNLLESSRYKTLEVSSCPLSCNYVSRRKGSDGENGRPYNYLSLSLEDDAEEGLQRGLVHVPRLKDNRPHL